MTASSSGHLVAKINFNNINLRNGLYATWKAYTQSKLAKVLLSRELAKRLGSHIKAYCLHPEPINTDLQRNNNSLVGKAFMKCSGLTPEEGAQTTLYCVLKESRIRHYYK